ncbi:BRO-N domain-containing protein [Azorhizophilus paspali]|uniref:BRO-N domain-containing protein n=1 Tax=Azorhizophilus paspali TaxID=69963 RepID=UPI003748C5AD
MQALAFHNIQFDVIDRDGQPWLGVTQIGLALEYANPETAITKLFNRNADEFTDKMTALINLPTKGGVQQVRIFSLRGAHLLAMFARTEVAKEFRKWVLDVLDREVAQEQPLPAPSLTTRRWLVYFDHMGREQIKPVPEDACVLSHRELIKAMVRTPGDLPVSTEEMFEFVAAAMANLKARADYQSSRIKMARKAGLKI